MKLYKLYFAKPLLVFYLLILGAWVLAGVAGILFGAFGKLGSEGPPVWIFIILLFFAVLNGSMWLRFPFEIKLRDDPVAEFRIVFRRITVSPVEIKSVRAKPYALGFVDVLYQGGTVHLLSQMDGFHEFITTLKSLNPAIGIPGC